MSPVKTAARPQPRPASATQRVGRFELKRVLGKGAQATVWLACDARLDRDVALKLIDPDADSLAVQQWLHEARAVSRLAHPNVVPLFEADEGEGAAPQPYLVFEYVEGPTLSQMLRSRGPLAAPEAVSIMSGVLDALAAAHAQGIVHRDLKPSNILLGKDGRPRVMDFGIAARVAGRAGPANDHEQGRICGTPGYISPEAARGEAPIPAMDVFACGMLLGELLSGTPLLRERDPWVAIRRVQDEDVQLPTSATRDEGLAAILRRALERDPTHRYADAAAMQRALGAWAKPAAVVAEAGGNGAGTLEFLLRRMKRKTDFPALSSAVTRIQRVANSERESLHSLSEEILKDVALTNKLLRMVNSVHFAQAGAGGVSTVSRAVALVGFAGIRNMALSVVLMDHMQDKAHAQLLKEEFLRALMAGHLAGELTPAARDAEEIFIGALFQNLGRLLAEFYFPEEAQQVRGLSKPATAPGGDLAGPADEALASARVLGISYEELGLGVAKSWGLPDSLRETMRKPAGEPPSRPLGKGVERARWVAAAANEVADVMLNSEPQEAAQRIGAVAERHARALGLAPQALREAAAAAREKLKQMAQAMQIEVAAGSPARRLLVATPSAGADAPPAEHDSLAGTELQATQRGNDAAAAAAGDAPTVVAHREAPTEVAAPPRKPREQIAQLLSAGVQDITNSMVQEHFKLNDVLRMVLETMMRALGFQRVIFCLRDPKTEALTGRFGLGERARELAPHFKVPLKCGVGAKPDLFAAVCQKGADTLISDATVGAIAARLPAWHRDKVRAPAFLLLPMALKGAPFALIYADMAAPGAIELDEKELNLLRTLRNQAVMGFRQAG